MLGHVVFEDKGVMSCLYAFHHLLASERDFYTCLSLRYGNNEKKNWNFPANKKPKFHELLQAQLC